MGQLPVAGHLRRRRGVGAERCSGDQRYPQWTEPHRQGESGGVPRKRGVAVGVGLRGSWISQVAGSLDVELLARVNQIRVGECVLVSGEHVAVVHAELLRDLAQRVAVLDGVVRAV